MAKIYALIIVLLSYSTFAFEVGFNRTQIETPEGIALAGFGNKDRRNWSFPKNPFHLLLKASTDVHDPVYAKTLFIQKGSKKLAIVSVDMVAASARLRGDLAHYLSDLGFTESEIYITATHTHSGPGLFADDFLWQVIAADLYNQRFYDILLKNVESSIRQAFQNRRTALFGWSQIPLVGTTRNRRLNIDQPVLATVFSFRTLLLKPIVTVLNFPIHGTFMNAKNLEMTADIPGAIEKEFEKLSGSPTFFWNGAEGDISPISTKSDFTEMDQRGATIAQKLLTGWKLIIPTDLRSFDFQETTFNLGPTKLNVLACINGLPGLWSIKAPLFLPQQTQIGFLKLNEHVSLWVPGEATTEVGIRLELAARRIAKPLTTSIVGLTNDHISYIVSEREYMEGGYEACSSLYGSDLADRLHLGYEEFLKLHF